MASPVRVIHDNLTSAEDDSIQRFTQEFNRLRSSFSDGTNIQTWIVVHNVEINIAQLTSTLETVKDIGERIYSLNLLILFVNGLQYGRERTAVERTAGSGP